MTRDANSTTERDALGRAELYYLGLPLYMQTRRNAIVTLGARTHTYALLGAAKASTYACSTGYNVRVCVGRLALYYSPYAIYYCKANK